MKRTLRVIKGKGRGKQIGIPTINCEIPRDFRLEQGIYAGWIHFGNKKYPSAIHFGPRPMFGEHDLSLEAYLLEPLEHKVPSSVVLETVSFVREIKSFPTVGEMVAQIEKDIQLISDILLHINC